MGEASLRLEFKEDGIYLVSLAEGMPDLSDVVDLLKQKGVENYDGDAIVAFLKEKQQEPFKIAERDPANERDAVVEVQINADGMSADLRISPPTGDKPWPTVDFLQKSLAEKGVVFGVRSALLMSGFMLPQDSCHKMAKMHKLIFLFNSGKANLRLQKMVEK